MEQRPLTTTDQADAGAAAVVLTNDAANALDDIRWTTRASGLFIGSKYPPARLRELVLEKLIQPLDHGGSLSGACKLTELGRGAKVRRV